MRIFSLVLSLSVVILFARQADAFDCPESPPPVQLSHDVKNQVNASVGKVAGLSAGELSIQTEVAAKNLYENFPSVDKLVIAQAMISTYCSMLKGANLSDTEKLDRWERFQSKVMQFPVDKNDSNGAESQKQESSVTADQILDAKFKTPITNFPTSSRYVDAGYTFVVYNQYLFGKEFRVRQDISDGGTSTAHLEFKMSGGWEKTWGNLTGESNFDVREACTKTTLDSYVTSLADVYGAPTKVSPTQESEKEDAGFPPSGWFTHKRTRGAVWKLIDGSYVIVRQGLEEYFYRNGKGDNPWGWECRLEICLMPKNVKKPCFELPGVLL